MQRRKVLLTQDLPPEYVNMIRDNIPIYDKMPAALQNQLAGMVNVFLAEKKFQGCGGLEITDEIKVTIAAQASMLLLNRKTSYFKSLKNILVYPHTYLAKNVSFGNGVMVEEDSARLGESWQNGPVVLAWDSIKGGASNIGDGRNVVFHEFSHQLDQEDGAADGAPILEKRSCYKSWAKVLSSEYENLLTAKSKGHRSVINKYGATNPAEFFAVATEAFFEKPRQLHKRHPELYEELKQYYHLDPEKWGS